MTPRHATAQKVHLEWKIWAVYSTSKKCEKMGQLALDSAQYVDYKCEWDSPGYALWLEYFVN